MSKLFFLPAVNVNTRGRKTNEPEVKMVPSNDTLRGMIRLNEAGSELLKVGHGDYVAIMNNAQSIRMAELAGEIEEGTIATSFYISKGSMDKDGNKVGFKLAATSKVPKGTLGIILNGTDTTTWAKLNGDDSEHKVYSISKEETLDENGESPLEIPIYEITFDRVEPKMTREEV